MTMQYVLSTSDFFSPHILYSTYSTHCLFTFTLVVNPLLTTIVHHIFSSVLAEPHSNTSLLHIYPLSRTFLLSPQRHPHPLNHRG